MRARAHTHTQSFRFSLFAILMGGLISIADDGSSGGGIARVLADIASHSSNMTRGVFAQLQPLLCT